MHFILLYNNNNNNNNINNLYEHIKKKNAKNVSQITNAKYALIF